MTDQTIPPLNEPPTPAPNPVLEAIRAALDQPGARATISHVVLPADMRPERLSHTELVPRGRLIRWWEGIWFTLFRVLGGYVAPRCDILDDEGLDLVFGTLYDVRPRDVEIVTVYDETEAEHLARLQRLYGARLHANNAAIDEFSHLSDIPVTFSPHVRPGTAYLFDARAGAMAVPPTSVQDVTVDPTD